MSFINEVGEVTGFELTMNAFCHDNLCPCGESPYPGQQQQQNKRTRIQWWAWPDNRIGQQDVSSAVLGWGGAFAAAKFSAYLRSFADLHTLWTNPNSGFETRGAPQQQDLNLRKYQDGPLHGTVFTLSPSHVWFTRWGVGGKSCGHVFLEVHGFTDTVCNTVTTALRSLSFLSRLRGFFPRDW